MNARNRIKLLSVMIASALLVVLMLGGVNLHLLRAQDDSITIWTKFNDQNPQNAVDRWIASALEDFTAETGIAASNIFNPYDQINARLNLAVTAGGDVPDVSYVDSQFLGIYQQNGSLMDITDYVTSAEWFDDLDPRALEACTTGDGRILCVPTTSANFFVYYWTDGFPDGYPTTTEELIAMAEDLKANGNFALTFKAAEYDSIERVYYNLIHSFGGRLADDDGRAVWASEETAAAMQFIRDLFANEYVPEVALAPGFDFEEPFKDGSALSFMAGSFSYVYLTPLEAPDGTLFEEDIPETGFDRNAVAVGAAYEDGLLGFAPPLTAPGGEPASLILASAWAIPVGSQNVEGAQAFIDRQMTTDRNIDFAVAYGALPSLISGIEDEAFDSPYWNAVAEYQAQYAVAAPALADYDLGLTLLSDAIVRIITDPGLDIMTELQAAQDEYNASIE